MEHYLNTFLMEDEGGGPTASVTADTAEFTPRLGAGKPIRRKMKSEDKSGRGHWTTTSQAEKDAIKKKAKEAEAKSKKKITDSTQQIQKDNNMIEETSTYKYFQEGEKKVFEILDEKDFTVFYQGLKKSNVRFWRETPTNEKMLEYMNENKGKWFEVRFGNRSYKPLDNTI